ncbi:hypothetical protein GQ457_01G033230 [Hibiscus cannabinus]
MRALMQLVILVPCSFFLIALIKFLYDYLWTPLRIQRMLNSQGIKGPPYRFIHGNRKEVAKMRQEALSKHLGLTDNMFPYVQPHIYSWINKYGKNYVSWDGARAQLLISEPILIQEVLKNSEKGFPKREPLGYGRKLQANGLTVLEGERWAKRRKLVNHAFNGESLKNMIPALIASVEAMLEKWKEREGKEMDIFEEIRILTSEMISRTAFGSSYLVGEKFFDMLNKLSVIVGRDAMKMKIPLIDKFWKGADFVESEQLVKAIQDCVMEIVKEREEKVVSGEADNFGYDFVGILVNAYRDSDEKNRLSTEDLVDECKLFFLAAQATVNSLIAWSLMCLAIHEDWQEKARSEVIETFGNQNPDSEGIAKLKIITMIIHETERLYGQPNPLMRKVGREARVRGLVLPANIDIRLAMIAVHHDPQLWGDDAHLFKPERFAEGIAKATRNNAAAFFPFGLGPRTCIGISFAYAEAKIALSMILQRYAISLSPAYVHSPQVHLSLRPRHGIQVMLHPLQ